MSAFNTNAWTHPCQAVRIRRVPMWLLAVTWCLAGICSWAFAAEAQLAVPVVQNTSVQNTPAQISYQLFSYSASLAGASAGSASIAVLRDGAGYRIVGQAKAEGLLDALSPWRSQFHASGRWAQDQPYPQHFQYVEQGRDKRRLVRVRNGELTVSKNGKQRPTRSALPGLDVLAALFASGQCKADIDLHTGRHAYRLKAVSDMEQDCRYQVTDDDGDSFATRILFAQYDGYRVPRRIEISGPLAGVLTLQDSKQISGQCAGDAAGPLEYLCGEAAET